MSSKHIWQFVVQGLQIPSEFKKYPLEHVVQVVELVQISQFVGQGLHLELEI